MADKQDVPHTHSLDTGPKSAVAIISYIILAQLTLAGLGVFVIIALQVTVEPVMVGVLSGLITGVVAGSGTVGGFWLASSVGSRATSSAMAQLAGAGPPPPSAPMAEKPKP
jgi:hypothetical protein